MNCEQADERLGAYAVDALPPAEAGEVRAHLARCGEHAAAAADLRAVATRLVATAGPAQPPDALRERVLAAIAAEPRDSAATPAPIRPRSRAASAARRVDAPRSFPRWRVPYGWGSLAAVVVAALAGLLIWNFVLLNRLDDEGDIQRFALTSRGTDATGTIFYLRDQGRAVVIADGLTPLDPDEQTYQLWAIRDEGTPESIGLMQADAAGSATAVVPYDADDARTLAVTIEPAGGSPAPTTEPIFATEV